MCKLKIVTIFGFLGLLLTLKPAYSDDYKHLRATTVPASSCKLRDPRDGSKVYLSNGAWRFKSNQTGTVHFYCPLPVNENSLANTRDAFYQNIIYTYYNKIDTYQVWYVDPDGQGHDYRVAARLYKRYIDSGLIRLKAVGKSFDSNKYNATHTRYQKHSLTLFITPVALGNNTIYHFGVTMVRNNTRNSPGFIGINFDDHPD